MEPNRLLNLRSRVLHRYPAFESCNIDAIPLTKRLLLDGGEITPEPYRHCRRCFKNAG